MNISKNMGSIDRITRIVLAVILIALYFSHTVSGTIAVVLLAFSLILIATSFISFCPIYTFLNINTKNKETE